MTAPSINPRRFSRGEDNLDPDAHMCLWMSFATTNETGAVERVGEAVEHYKAQYPQAAAQLVALQSAGAQVNVILEIDLGPTRAALLGTSIGVKAGYGLLRALVKHLFHLHPIFVVEPTASDRELYSAYVSSAGE